VNDVRISHNMASTLSSRLEYVILDRETLYLQPK